MTGEAILILKVNCVGASEIEDSLALLYFNHMVSYVYLTVPHKSVFLSEPRIESF